MVEHVNMTTGEIVPSSDLALIDRARAALAEARTIDEVREIHDQAAAWERYLARKDGADQAARHAAEIRLRACRRLGEILRETVRHQGGRPGETVPPGHRLPDGVSRKDSSRWQRIADLSEDAFEEELGSDEPTTSALLRRWKSEQAKPGDMPAASDTCTTDDLRRLIDTGRRFGTIYADPPWAYGNQATRASTDNHYQTMSIADICALPVKDLAAENSHLHLWTTNAFLRESFDVMAAWGFEYKSLFVWVKPQMGIGNYWRVSHELMLFGLRGKAPFVDRSLMSWAQMDRTEHSRKPEAVRSMIEKASPGPRLELFGRRVAHGWTVWGNEIERGLLDGGTHEV